MKRIIPVKKVQILLAVLLAVPVFSLAQTSLSQPDAALEVDWINTASVYANYSQSVTHSTDYGVLNDIPLEKNTSPDSFGSGKKVFYFRNRIPFQLRGNQVAKFRLHLGEVEQIFLWPESSPEDMEWSVKIVLVHGDSVKEPYANDLLHSGHYRYLPVVPNSTIEVSLQLRGGQGSLPKQVWLTVSPELFDENPDGTVMPINNSLEF